MEAAKVETVGKVGGARAQERATTVVVGDQRQRRRLVVVADTRTCEHRSKRKRRLN